MRITRATAVPRRSASVARRRITAALAIGALAAGSAVAAVGAAQAAPPAGCRPWGVSVVAAGFGPLENVAFDGRGRMLLANQTPVGPGGSIATLTASGQRGVLVPNVTGPGAMVVRGSTVYFNTGNTAAAGVIGKADGTISAVDLDGGGTRVVARGLVMPNGLAQLPDGDFVVSRDAGLTTGLTLIPHDGAAPRPFAPGLSSPNGLAWDAHGGRLLASTFLTPTSTVAAVRPDGRWSTLTTFPGLGIANSADDLTVDDAGVIYQALNVGSRVVRFDPATNGQCVIGTVPLVSSVRFGGTGWDPRSVYASSFTGTVFRLSPPA